MKDSIITTKNLTKSFTDGDKVTTVLKGVEMHIERGEFVAIMGRSGAGKSTLLYQISLLDTPTSGEIVIDNINIQDLSEDERINFRLNKLGYVFQDYALLPDLTSMENVALPLLMQGYTKDEAYKRAVEVLDQVGLQGKYGNIPAKLSGGQQQRVSIARALAHNPTILFADEPTANLDTESSLLVLKIFKEIHAKGQTIVMVTHEAEYAKTADRVIEMKDGVVE
ncbi:ABC transporter ATP-binding protein [Arenimonas sp.]|nr:ABC transporter ATP-binding protein [Candidatus Parcubacteria bacterium]